MAEEYKKCEKCGTLMTGGDYCLYCKSLESKCEINCRGYKEMYCSVPWCFKYYKRLVHLNWCKECEHYKEDK